MKWYIPEQCSFKMWQFSQNKNICVCSWLSVCSIAPCIYRHGQIWPADLCKDSMFVINEDSVSPNTEPSASATATSNRQWVMLHVFTEPVTRLECHKMKVDLSCELLSACSFSKQKTSRRLTKFPCLHVACLFTDLWYYMTHKLRSDAQRRRNISWPCSLTPRLLRKASRVCGEERGLTSWSSPIHNE